MPERTRTDRLDDAVEAVLRRPEDARVPEDPKLAALWRVAVDLVDLPAPAFRDRLAADIRRRSTMSMNTMSMATADDLGAVPAPAVAPAAGPAPAPAPRTVIPNLSVRGAA